MVLHQYQHVAVVHVFFYPAKFSWQGVACFTNHGGSAIVSPRCYNSTSSLSLCGVPFSEKNQQKSKTNQNHNDGAATVPKDCIKLLFVFGVEVINDQQGVVGIVLTTTVLQQYQHVGN